MNTRANLVNAVSIIISVILTIGISNFLGNSKQETPEGKVLHEVGNIPVDESASIIQIVKLKSSLSESELMKIAKDRAVNFRELTGLKQKYYLRLGEPGSYAGVYIWKSKEDMMKFAKSELAASIKDAYSVEGKPSVEVSDVLFKLRD